MYISYRDMFDKKIFEKLNWKEKIKDQIEKILLLFQI